MTSSPRYVDFAPRWPRPVGESSPLDDVPLTGVEPEFIPRLPTRLLPFAGGSAVSGQTLGETINSTQRILNFVGYEVVHGPHPHFADLRRVEESVLELSRMRVEPFDEGSFVIPATLPDEPIEIHGRRFSGRDVLDHFVQVMDLLASGRPTATVSIGLVQAVEDLARVIRREAEIEYCPTWTAEHLRCPRPIRVNATFIDSVSRIRADFQQVDSVPDILEGRLVALNVVKGTLELKLRDKASVRGTFGPLIQQQLIAWLNQPVRLHGTVQFKRGEPTFIRAFMAELLDETSR